MILILNLTSSRCKKVDWKCKSERNREAEQVINTRAPKSSCTTTPEIINRVIPCLNDSGTPAVFFSSQVSTLVSMQCVSLVTLQYCGSLLCRCLRTCFGRGLLVQLCRKVRSKLLQKCERDAQPRERRQGTQCASVNDEHLAALRSHSPRAILQRHL